MNKCTIQYELPNHEKVTLEVSEEIATILSETKKKGAALRKQDQRHLSSAHVESTYCCMMVRPEGVKSLSFVAMNTRAYIKRYRISREFSSGGSTCTITKSVPIGKLQPWKA